MPTFEEIKKQISLIKGADTFGTKKEVRHLPEIMHPDEVVKGLTSGMMDANTWLVVCTNKRVIFLDKGMIYGLKKIETPLDKINTVESKTGMFFGEIGIWDGSTKMVIKQVMKNTVQSFVSAVNVELERVRKERNGGGVGPVDVADQLKKLSDLKAQGILTEEEFIAQKRKLLDK